jgi:hypothetical protein
MVATAPDGDFEAEGDGVRKSQLHLAMIPAGAEDAQVGDRAVAGANDRHGLLGREKTVLV